MQSLTLRPQPEGRPYLEFGFSSLSALTLPRAILSRAESGDMRYDPAGETAQRRAFFAQLGLESARVAALPLKHTRRVVFVKDGREPGPLLAEAASTGGADGLVVEGQAWVPALTVADCMPIWLHDARRGVIGLLHSGWRGTGILAEAVRGMEREFGSQPADIEAILGPCIGACCYAVPEERAQHFALEFGARAVRMESTDNGGVRHYIDLRAANTSLAEGLGLGRLIDINLCTACSPALGSYRRQGPADFTRMVALCGFF
ncbi:MAG: polyphenol oxidase family protein [Rectinemataceae bacterium]|nr:polyphenol oxidase family protein [Rectinemataceae bacterium]